MSELPFLTTVVGSMPKRPWLFTPATAIDGRRDHFAEAGSWSLEGERLRAAQDDAVRVVLREQERAGIDDPVTCRTGPPRKGHRRHRCGDRTRQTSR